MDTADKLKVFCYGSNMSSKRLTQINRCPSAQFFSIAKLTHHALRLHKQSKKDGSAKADCFRTDKESDLVWGVIFEIDYMEKHSLDGEEGKGKGYNEKSIEVITNSNEKVKAIIYQAEDSAIDDSLLPFEWYMKHILIGAKEFQLPAEYIAELEKIKTHPDLDKNREKKEMSIYSSK